MGPVVVQGVLVQGSEAQGHWTNPMQPNVQTNQLALGLVGGGALWAQGSVTIRHGTIRGLSPHQAPSHVPLYVALTKPR